MMSVTHSSTTELAGPYRPSVKSRALAEGLKGIRSLKVEGDAARTNMVFVSVASGRAEHLKSFLAERDVLIGKGDTVRLVTHLDVDRDDIDRVVEAVTGFFERAA